MTKEQVHQKVAEKFARFTEVEKQQAVFRAYKMGRGTAKDWIIEWLDQNYPDKELLAYCDFTYNGLEKVI